MKVSIIIIIIFTKASYGKGVVVQCCNPLTLQLEWSDGVGSITRRASSLELHDKGSRIRLGPLYLCDPCAWHLKTQLHLHFHVK